MRRPRSVRSVLVAACLVLASAAAGREPAPAAARVMMAHALEGSRVGRHVVRARVEGPHLQPVDVQHVDVDLRIDPAARTVAGTVTTRFATTDRVPTLHLRLDVPLRVTAVELDGSTLAGVVRSGTDLAFSFTPPLLPHSEHELAVTYAGSPAWRGGGMIFAKHGAVMVAATQAEPYDAYRWWPNTEDVSDKFTADIRLTVPQSMVAASNGTLDEVVSAGGGFRTFHWVERYPIANYNVCANVTNYYFTTAVYTALDGVTTMPIAYYVYPEDRVVAAQNFARTPDAIHFFAQLAGEYPFIAEKYGQVEVPYPGMEHQTLTAIDANWVRGEWPYGPGTAELMYFHELAHHWWGDDVTCATWHDVWLNEGFATYFEALWFAHDNDLAVGALLAESYDDGTRDGFLGGTVYVADDSRPFADQGAIYQKGAWVLHMLREVMGDERFFTALRAYRTRFRLGSATTADFQRVCEAAYGQRLDWFFDQWVFTPERPVYRVTLESSAGVASVRVAQEQTQLVANRSAGRDVYFMPVTLTLHFADGTSEARRVWNDERVQTFELSVSKPVAAVGFDEGHAILRILH